MWMFGRLFGYYSMSVQSIGSGNVKHGFSGIRFVGIKNAVEFKNHFNIALQEHANEARRLQVEEIGKEIAKEFAKILEKLQGTPSDN